MTVSRSTETVTEPAQSGDRLRLSAPPDAGRRNGTAAGLEGSKSGVPSGGVPPGSAAARWRFFAGGDGFGGGATNFGGALARISNGNNGANGFTNGATASNAGANGASGESPRAQMLASSGAIAPMQYPSLHLMRSPATAPMVRPFRSAATRGLAARSFKAAMVPRR